MQTGPGSGDIGKIFDLAGLDTAGPWVYNIIVLAFQKHFRGKGIYGEKAYLLLRQNDRGKTRGGGGGEELWEGWVGGKGRGRDGEIDRERDR